MQRYSRNLLPAFFIILLLCRCGGFATALTCRSQCGSISIRYPFGVDDGCGAPQFRKMLMCNTTTSSSSIISRPGPGPGQSTSTAQAQADVGALYFVTPNGNYKVQSIDYDKQTMSVYDPDMSTCAILQPHHDLVLSDIQYALIPPSPDTVFALLNCSLDSPVLNRYSSLCFNFSGHSCDELYSACNSFKIFTETTTNSSTTTATTTTTTTTFTTTTTTPPPALLLPPSPPTTAAPPPCCFTGYSTVKFMTMDMLDCSHYTSVYDTDGLQGVGPMDWTYGIKFSFAFPDTGCDRCTKSGGSCGFDTATDGLLCLCSNTINSTRECPAGTGSFTSTSSVVRNPSPMIVMAIAMLLTLKSSSG